MTTPYDLTIANLTIRVDKDVYPTSELSELIVQCMDHSEVGVRSTDAVLDYGCGTGFLAVCAALRGANVIAVDINSAAVDCAKNNASRHNVSQLVDVRLSHSFSAIDKDERFNIIFAGIPWEEAETLDVLERSVYDPNFEARRTLFDRALEQLLPGGRIFMTYSQRVQEIYPLENTHPAYTYEPFVTREIKGVPHYAMLIRRKHE